MGFNDFWIHNNGKKERLSDPKHGVRKDQIDQKFQNLFDAYDVNQDGILEGNELAGIFKSLKAFAGADKILDKTENNLISSIFKNEAVIEDTDFQGFVKALSDASEEIIESSAAKGEDGGNIITTKYKDGTTEIIYYYPDGEYKMKKTIQDTVNISYSFEGKTYTGEELEKRIKKDYKNFTSLKDSLTFYTYEGFAQKFFEKHKVKRNVTENHKDLLDISERAKKDIEVKDFILSHFIETHRNTKEAMDTMGILDDIGAAINAGAGELWNASKNIYNKYFGEGAEEDYQNFYELVKKFEPNYDKALSLNGAMETMRNHPEMYVEGFQKNTGLKIDNSSAEKFKVITEQFQNAQIMKQRIDILNQAMREVGLYQTEQNALTYAPVQNEGLNPASHILKANELLLQYFNGDKEAADLVLQGVIGNADKTMETIKGLLADSEKINCEILKGRSFEEIKDDYKKQYKEIYDVDFVPEDLTEKVMDAKATGGMVKLAAITIISIIVTRSPALTSLAAGSDTAAAAGIMRTLVSKYGQSAVQQGIKFAMTSGTLAADVGLTLLNQVTSERGINGEELWESTKGSAKYIYFGAYIGAPIAQNVGRALGRIGLAKNLFKGGVSSSQGPITTTSVNGEQFAKNLMEQGKQWSTKLISKGGALGTEIGMFSALEIAVDGANVQDAVSEQGTFLPKLKIMNHILEYMLGAKAHKAVMKEPKIELAIQQSGIKTWNIKEIKTPSGTKYTVDIDGIPIGNFKDANTLAAAMMERVAAAYEGVNAGVGVNGDAASSTAQAGNVGVREAVAENPAENVTSRVEKEVYKNEFKDEGMRLNTPERLESELRQAEANPKAPTENIEALSMVASGKTKQLMTQRYNEMAKILDEIHTKYAKEIKQMESKYGSKPQVFAEHFMKFLAAKMGVAGCEPKLEFKKTEGDGAYDWQSGELHISEQLNNLKDIKTMIAHEFIHTLQFRNILAAYGREGIVELYLKHNDGKAIDELTRKYVKNEMEIELEDLGLSNAEVSALQRQVAEAYADQCLGNEANARLLRHAQQNPVEKGSLNSYMARLQLDNLIKPEEFDTEAYYRSTNETEAYFLGNGQITGRNSAGETGKASGRRSESEAGISIPQGKSASSPSSKDNVLDALQQLGASDKQMMDFSANCTDEMISYIASRMSAPDFNPVTENYFIHLKPFNLALIQELAADPKFPKEQLGLVANAAYSPNFVNQIRNAYKKGIDIIPGCQRVAQMKAAQEARMNDPAAIAKKEAWVNAVKRLEENTSLSKGDINQLADYGNIRETAIQDLIIFCEKNGIKNYHTILLRCSENREGNNISSKEIETRVKFAQKGLENKVNPAEVSRLLWEYEKFSPEEMETRLNTVIKETRIENERLLAKETAIANKKNSLLEKYNSAEIKEIIERIINKENLPEDLLNSLDEILGGNPNSAKCRYLEKCVSEIKPEEFRLESFKRDFEAGLKKPDLTSGRDSKWQSRPNAKNVILTQEYLSSLKDKNGKPVFNQMVVESLLEAGKTNPELVKEVVDMAVEESRLRAPAVIIPLLDAAAIDKDMAFSVLSMKTNNGEPRFNTLELDFVLSSFKSKLPLVKEVFNLERLYDMDIDASGVLLHAESVENVRAEFSYKYCRALEGMKKSNGSPMYHSYWDIQEGIQKALIDNPEVTLYYLKKNVPTERTAYDGKVIKALINIAQNSAKLEKSLRQELENIKNDENRVQRDEVLRRIRIFSEATDLDNALKIYEHREELGLGNRINYILEKADAIPYENLVYLRDILGKERISTMLMNDLLVAGQFAHLAKVSNINEIPLEGKKNLLRNLISTNSTLFGMSDELAKDFPMLPRNQEQYCEILPAIVRSLGIETTPLTSSKVEVFNKNLNKLSKNLAQISDKEFASLHITQEFSKDDFVKIVLEKVKDLPQTERQKVFDYFGFELNKNEGNKTTGYSIIGYPVNLNNGKKLAQITDPKTQAVVENLRPDVIKFSQNNHIKCENSQIESLLNEIAEVLPEIRTAIGKTQHGTHDYDIMQHSLKVMQKISQDPKFKTLNESDQKIMFLASILHDITKREGFSDKTHANNGSFDTFFIAKKFNLTRAEEIKLYTLIKHHEWLGFVNTSESQEQLTKRLQSVAYDLQHDNLFDMALMFTHADLKAVKKDDSFHDRTDGENRTTLEGTQRSYGASADVYAERLKGMVAELQKSQPLLPVTKIPAVSRMKQAVTNVNSDGSTNIKGVYIDKDGLMIIKFNEVEDWEALGFPKGTTSRGIAAKGLNGRGQECDVETGNIKFFAHALDYANQLAKFDAFGLVDSDVLLSVSYAERPESKFRFFRSQGVLLNVETKYIHGGGNTDSGSGCGKNIQNFKDRYIFGGERESDRLYISNMIKEATGMNDTQYVDFVKANENRSFTEIEPAEYREKIIKAFATINSNVRKGNREYNEMYASNPDVMAVFAYSKNYKNSVGQPVEFVNSNAERLDFLRNFALERDIPMIVFGD